MPPTPHHRGAAPSVDNARPRSPARIASGIVPPIPHTVAEMRHEHDQYGGTRAHTNDIAHAQSHAHTCAHAMIPHTHGVSRCVSPQHRRCIITVHLPHGAPQTTATTSTAHPRHPTLRRESRPRVTELPVCGCRRGPPPHKHTRTNVHGYVTHHSAR